MEFKIKMISIGNDEKIQQKRFNELCKFYFSEEYLSPSDFRTSTLQKKKKKKLVASCFNTGIMPLLDV